MTCLSRRIPSFLQVNSRGISCLTSIGLRKLRFILRRPCSEHQTVQKPSLGSRAPPKPWVTTQRPGNVTKSF